MSPDPAMSLWWKRAWRRAGRVYHPQVLNRYHKLLTGLTVSPEEFQRAVRQWQGIDEPEFTPGPPNWTSRWRTQPTGVKVSVFAENFSRVVVPRAEELGISPSTAAQQCSVHGQFADERSTIAYCMAYAWMHFASFKAAIEVLNIKPREFPHRPLIIDIGCGPGTALSAFGEWFCATRRRRSDVRYVGIDRSEYMRTLAASFATDSTLFEDHLPVLMPAAEDLTPELLDTLAPGRDGVILTMSYVLHQDFMADGQAFTRILRTLSGSRLPIWILAQDANKPHVDEANVETWPETRLRGLLNATELYGYHHRLWCVKFEARKYVLDEQGHATELPAEGHQRTKAIAARLDPT